MQIDHRRRARRDGVLARHDHHFLEPAGSVNWRTTSGPARVVGLGGQAGQAADRFGAHVFVGIGAGDVAQHCDVVEPRDGRPPHAGFGVFTRERDAAPRLRRARVRRRRRRGRRGRRVSSVAVDGVSREFP